MGALELLINMNKKEAKTKNICKKDLKKYKKQRSR